MNASTASRTAELNNQGVSLLEQGLPDQAVAIFSQGLALAKHAIALANEDDMDMADNKACCQAQDVQSPSCHFSKLSPHSQEVDCSLRETVCDDKPFIFRHPLVIPDHAAEDCSYSKYFVKMSFIILYNLALTHHLSGSTNLYSVRKLRKALSLYELAYTIQMTEEIQLSVLETMAIVNNLGQIHLALGNEAKAEQCFRHLLSTLMFVGDYGESSSIAQLEGFFCSCTHLILKDSTAGAA